jgi:hypothetical protein
MGAVGLTLADPSPAGGNRPHMMIIILQGDHPTPDLPVFVGLAQVGGDLCESVIQHGEVVGGGVRAGVAAS